MGQKFFSEEFGPNNQAIKNILIVITFSGSNCKIHNSYLSDGKLTFLSHFTVGTTEVCGGSPSPAKAELNEGTSALTVLQPVHSQLSPSATYTPLPSFSQYPSGTYCS